MKQRFFKHAYFSEDIHMNISTKINKDLCTFALKAALQAVELLKYLRQTKLNELKRS